MGLPTVKFHESPNGLGTYTYPLASDCNGDNAPDDGMDCGLDTSCYVAVGRSDVTLGLMSSPVFYENSHDRSALNVYVLIGTGRVHENCILVTCTLLLGFKVWWTEYCMLGGDANFHSIAVVTSGVVSNGTEDWVERLFLTIGNVHD